MSGEAVAEPAEDRPDGSTQYREENQAANQISFRIHRVAWNEEDHHQPDHRAEKGVPRSLHGMPPSRIESGGQGRQMAPRTPDCGGRAVLTRTGLPGGIARITGRTRLGREERGRCLGGIEGLAGSAFMTAKRDLPCLSLTQLDTSRRRSASVIKEGPLPGSPTRPQRYSRSSAAPSRSIDFPVNPGRNRGRAWACRSTGRGPASG